MYFNNTVATTEHITRLKDGFYLQFNFNYCPFHVANGKVNWQFF